MPYTHKPSIIHNNAANSTPVYSIQTAPHQHLENIVRKHCATYFQREYAEFSRQTLNEIQCLWQQSGKNRLILDSCCGTGESTARIASINSDAFVIGLDKSSHRLHKHQIISHIFTSNETARKPNYAVVRADVIDMWRLFVEAGWHFSEHYLLYPNPYPKPHHFLRRWHGHPVFSTLIQLSEHLEVRTNWRVYAEEMLQAYHIACAVYAHINYRTHITTIDAEEPITAFERKYAASGHTLYKVLCKRGK